jgi:hypothetical protein
LRYKAKSKHAMVLGYDQNRIISSQHINLCRRRRTQSGMEAHIALAWPFLLDPARAFLFNATAIPANLLGYLTMWPQGQPRWRRRSTPLTEITNNMAIVPTANGSVSIFPSDATQLVLDAFGFFAP